MFASTIITGTIAVCTWCVGSWGNCRCLAISQTTIYTVDLGPAFDKNLPARWFDVFRSWFAYDPDKLSDSTGRPWLLRRLFHLSSLQRRRLKRRRFVQALRAS